MSDSNISPTLFPFPDSEDNSPLPLIVAEQWNFPLTHIEGEVYWYSILDWIAGLNTSDSNKASEAWTNLQRDPRFQPPFLKRKLPYIASNGKTYQMDFTDDKGLYLIAQELRATKNRPLLKEIKAYLAKSGAFVDKIRREPEEVGLISITNPEEALKAIIEAFRRQGKGEDWIQARIFGIVSRNLFTAALKAAIRDMTQLGYAIATNEIYLGLWERTAEYLRNELELRKSENLRNHQPRLALYYQGIAEELSAHRLGERQELHIKEGLLIIREIATQIGQHAQFASEVMGIDIATGKPLLKDK